MKQILSMIYIKGIAHLSFIKFVVTWKIAEPGYKAKQANKETVYLFLSDKDISSEISRFMSVETNYFVQIKCTEEYKLTAFLSMMQNIMNPSITIEIENFTVKDMMKIIIAYLKLNYTIDFEIEINNINAFGNVPSRSAFGNYMPMMFI